MNDSATDVKSSPFESIRPLRHLLWKDLRLLRSLLLAALIGPLAVATLLCLIRWIWEGSSTDLDGSFATLLFLPGLVTLGAAPTLVGTENEERTFDWMRRLPTPWWFVVSSKMIAGLLLVLASIVWTGGIFVCCSFFLDLEMGSRSKDVNAGWVVFVGFCLLGYVNLVVLTCGFLTAFLIRNSLASAIAIIPFAIAWLVCVSLYASWMNPGSTGRLFDPQTSVGEQAVFAMAPLFAHLVVIGVVLWLARRRLVGPSDEPWRFFSWSTDVRPVALKMGVAERPSIVRALVWQHVQQNRWLLQLSLLTMCTALLAIVMMNRRSEMHGLITFPVLILLQMTLGVSVFHGDNRMPRRYFFADRGLSPALIWWTRMLVPASVSVVLSVVWVVVSIVLGFEAEYLSHWGVSLLVIYALCFLVGASTGQWVRRGVMAYFATPGVAYFAIVLAALATAPLPHGLQTMSVMSVAVVISLLALLGSTWHLTLLTLRGRERWGLWLPAWGWISLPIVVIAITSVSARLLEMTVLLGDSGG